jgi:transcriptional regulator with XRE-family HTH domain
LAKKTQRDMAGYIGVTTATIRNWRKDKPNLYEIVMKGFAFDAMVEKSEENLKELKELQQEFENKS